MKASSLSCLDTSNRLYKHIMDHGWINHSLSCREEHRAEAGRRSHPVLQDNRSKHLSSNSPMSYESSQLGTLACNFKSLLIPIEIQVREVYKALGLDSYDYFKIVMLLPSTLVEVL